MNRGALLIGGSVRKALCPQMAKVAASWDVCEIVPENWAPEDSQDAEILTQLSQKTRILLHSLSLSPLSGVQDEIMSHRVRTWAKQLGISMISDHFCWTGSESRHLGVFLPPIEPISVLRQKIRKTQDHLGLPLALENIAICAQSADAVMRYHETFLETCTQEGLAILLDLENIRLDALASGLKSEQILSLYKNVRIDSYHVAGGEQVGELWVDTHSHSVPQETLNLLKIAHAKQPAPIIYERDYSLDCTLIEEEVRKLQAFMERVPQ